jgi:heme/copper-type cytochrome/quinol oxidase subunit 1
MSTTDIAPEPVTDVPPGAVADDAGEGTFTALVAWLTSSDSKVIGRNFIGCSLLALVGAAVLGVLLGAERIDGGDTLLDAGALPQMFVGFRVALVFGVLVPLLLGIAVAAVPLQVGARSLAFPRLAAAGFWAWLTGLVLVAIALANNGGPGGGDEDMVDLFLAALALLVIGLAAAALPVAATVLTTRAPGMRMRRVPFFAWSALVATIGFLLVLPVLFGALIYLFVDHRYARALFGGNTGVGAWIGFAFTQPVTYLFALPAVGIVAELVPVTFRKRMPLRAVVYGGLALIGVAALSGVTQQINHDLPWEGSGADLDGFADKLSDLLPYALFTLLPLLGLVIVMLTGAIVARPPSDLETWVRPKVTPAFLFAFFGAGMILVGMLGGALVPITDLGLQGTVFEEGVLVYVVYGAVLAALGGLAWWRPKWSGRALPSGPAHGLALLGVVATILASLPYYAAGFADQPAASGTYDYGGPAEVWNVLVMIGHILMLVVVLAFLALWLRPRRDDDDPVDDDPWGGQTLEWLTSSPAPHDNFTEVHTVMSPEPVYDLHGPPGSKR